MLVFKIQAYFLFMSKDVCNANMQCACGYSMSAASLHGIHCTSTWPRAQKQNARGDFSGDMTRRAFYVSLIVFPLRSIIKKCADQTRGSYQIRPGKANYSDNNLSLYCCRHVSPYRATNTWNVTGKEEGLWEKTGHLNGERIQKWLLITTKGERGRILRASAFGILSFLVFVV